MKTICTSLLVLLAIPIGAAPLNEGQFTEIIREVSVLPPDASASRPGQVNSFVRAPERVRTGPESRAELTAADQTITRVGANTVFAFEDSGRAINLDKGSILFHAPKGRGGGVLKSGGVSAAVLGTTLLAIATADGGLKIILLEGEAQLTLINGKRIRLGAGKMFVLLPGDKAGRIYEVDLARLAGGSALLTGFAKPLPSQNRIIAAIGAQQRGRWGPASAALVSRQPAGTVDENVFSLAVGGGYTFDPSIYTDGYPYFPPGVFNPFAPGAGSGQFPPGQGP
jgi:hypothetical protein